MIITNPIDADITVKIKGTVYTVGAKASIKNVKPEHAEYWKTMLHDFLILSEEGSVSTEKKEASKEDAPAKDQKKAVAPKPKVTTKTNKK